MRIVRLKKNKNDFAISNLTLGQMYCIERLLQESLEKGTLGPVGTHLYADFNMDFGTLKREDKETQNGCFGIALTGKVKARAY